MINYLNFIATKYSGEKSGQTNFFLENVPALKSLLLAVSDDFFELGHELRVLLFFPRVVRSLNSIFHLLECLLEHSLEVGVHGLDVGVELLDFLRLLFLNFLFLSLNLGLFLLQRLQLFIVLVDALLELGIVLAQLFVGRLVLASHVRNNCVLSGLLRFLSVL